MCVCLCVRVCVCARTYMSGEISKRRTLGFWSQVSNICAWACVVCGCLHASEMIEENSCAAVT